MDYVALKAELDSGHPVTGAYDANNATALAQLNALNRTQNRTSMSGSEVINNVDAAEWANLTADEKQTVWDIVHLGDVNPFGIEATLMTNVFGGGSNTITALAAARVTSISRAQELGFSGLDADHIAKARTL